MVELLGKKDSLKNLNIDIGDIQTTIEKIVGTFQLNSQNLTYNTEKSESLAFIKSWKYPGEEACLVNVRGLLSKYVPSSLQEQNQLSHVALFELLIDRLLSFRFFMLKTLMF